MAARRRRKSRNPETPWLKYALFAAGGYFIYRILKNKGVLGGNGDEDYAIYRPGSVVRKVDKLLSSVPIHVFRKAPEEVVKLQQIKRQYDVIRERYEENKKSPLLGASYKEAKAAFNSLKREMSRAMAKARAKARADAAKRAVSEEDIKAAEESAKFKFQRRFNELQQRLTNSQAPFKLAVEKLRKLEGELSEAAKAQRVNDWIEGAKLAASRGGVATE